MERTKCARCGQRGHWARTCTNPPDERGKRRSGMNGFMIGDVATHAVPENQFIMCTYVCPEVLDTFIGLNVTAGYGLLDTGAQHGVIGLSNYKELCDRLAVQGLKPRKVPTLHANAVGVGGSTSFLSSAEIPVGIQGVSGVVTLNVIDTNLPLLLPMTFCKKLGMVLDTTNDTATWKHIGNKVSEVVTLPSDHIAIDLLEYPPGGWQNPHQSKTTVSDREPDVKITRADFETACAAVMLKPSSPQCELQPTPNSQDKHVPTSMPHPQELRAGEGTVYRDVFHPGRNGTLVRTREVVPLEVTSPESVPVVPDHCPADKVQADAGRDGLQLHVSDQGDLPCTRTKPVPLCPGGSSGKGPTSGRGQEGPRESACRSGDVSPHGRGHVGSGKQDHRVVDMQEVQVSLGEDQLLCVDASANRPGNGVLR